jgi:hypothetical protein
VTRPPRRTATQAMEIDEIPEAVLPDAFGREHHVLAWPERERGGPVLADVFEGLQPPG